MYMISRFIFAYINIFKLYVYKLLTSNRVYFYFPKVGRRFSTIIINKSQLYLNDLKARNDLNIMVNGGVLLFGKNCFVNNQCSFNCINKISVGDNTIFGEGVKIYDHDHYVSKHYNVSNDKFVSKPVKIGSDCWIGSNVLILKGVSIKNNVIIGASCVITKSISESGVYVMKDGELTKIR